MADQLIADTIRVLLERTVSVTANRIGLVLGFYKDLEDLHGYAKDIQAVLADAETKQSQNPIVLRWLQKVEGVAREASYVLDELLYESLHRHVKSRNKSKGAKVCLFFSLSKHDISFRWRMGSKVREINAKLKNFSTASVGLTRGVPEKGGETNSLPLHFVAGRTNQISDIVERLLMHFSESVAVLPIIGRGGLGKTTVAKSVYRDEKIDAYFCKKIWLWFPYKKFDVTEAFRGILESLKRARVNYPYERDALLQQIQMELNNERYLFVLDDVWNVDKNLWDDFYNSLESISTARGSCCVVTTRLQTTANLTSTVSPFMLEKLSDDDCWSILIERVTTSEDSPRELEVYKNQLSKKFQGLPLYAHVIANWLRMHSREEWISIVENRILNCEIEEIW